MVLSRFKKNKKDKLASNDRPSDAGSDAPNDSKGQQLNLLIIEDDSEQMELLVSFALSEMQKLLDDQSTSEKQKEKIKSIKIIPTTNIETLQKILSQYKNTFWVLMDCNIPDTKDGKPHDQLIKTNHAITGRHKTVDLIIDNLPGTPITMISTLNRFEKIVHKYYANKGDLDINFINKSDQEMIRRNVAYYLRQHLKNI